MKGKAAVVTGGSKGLGAAVCIGLAQRGVNVVVNYSSSAEAAENIAKLCRAEGVEAIAFKANVGEDAECVALAEAAVGAFGRLDILVNNAGVSSDKDSADLDGLDAAVFESIYRINVIGAFQMARAARREMLKTGGGSIVNVSSIGGVIGSASMVAYTASKGAMNTMTLALAKGFAPDVRVNAVCPGYIQTGWFEKYGGAASEDKVAEHMAEITPLKKASRPEDIAQSVVFFASDQSGHITGEHMIVDAGMHLGFAPLKAR